MNLDQRYGKALAARKEGNLLRVLPQRTRQGIDFTTNDYLCLSRHPEVVDAVARAARDYGTAGKASRLLGAESELARQLEHEIAQSKSDHGTALVFSSGFQLNHSVVSTILNKRFLGQEPLVFADRQIHASIHAGIHAAGIRQFRFRHNDLEHLESLLHKHTRDDSPKFVFVESIYSMDGDVTNLEQLYEMKARFGFYLYVDEAHAVGIAGHQGLGLSRHSSTQADFLVGTFSKSIGSSGGFLVTSDRIAELLINFAPGFVYSTAPSPPNLSAALTAWRLIPGLQSQRQHLHRLSTKLRQDLATNDYDTLQSESPIVPIRMGDASEAIRVSHLLGKQNLHVSCVRPPTVPANAARLRVSLNSGHSEDDIEKLASVLTGLPSTCAVQT